ncbi:hypothetical protein U9M48_014415 [Paspalum notatum var. saurae]|uniref:Cytochrome c oxidase copper chaperone n=1 Tax=Paspalum notatum var. saurae TaxID=547442 RepID=A0AAQ3WKQ0_PASNO
MSRGDGGGCVYSAAPLILELSRLPVPVRRRDSLRLPPLVQESADPDRGLELAPSWPRSSREMGNTASVKNEASDSEEQPATKASAPDTKSKKKICCACPDTKKLRDDCIVQNGEAACGKFIEAHLQCLRAEGFNV